MKKLHPEQYPETIVERTTGKCLGSGTFKFRQEAGHGGGFDR